MKYTKPTVVRLTLVAQMISKHSLCLQEGGEWTGQDCIRPQ